MFKFLSELIPDFLSTSPIVATFRNAINALQLATDLSPILDTLRLDITSLLQGTTTRTCLEDEPFELANTNPDKLSLLLNGQSAYLLYNEIIYHVHFQNATPIIQRCTFKDPRAQNLDTIRSYFPKVNEGIDCTIDAKLEAIMNSIEPISIGWPEFKIKSLTVNVPPFNSHLLRQYFNQPINRQDPPLPLIEFSEINFLTELPSANNFNGLQNPDFIPTLIYNQNKKECKLYGYVKEWHVTQLDFQIIVPLDHLWRADTTKLDYSAALTPLYLHILQKKAHIHYNKLPSQVSQMRKILLGIHFSKETLTMVGQLNGNVTLMLDIANEYWYQTGKISDAAHQGLLLLLTDYDIDLTERFAHLILEASFLRERFEDYSEWKHDADQQSDDKISLSYSMGHLMGFATRHIHSKKGDMDFEALSQLAADMPRHLDQLTTWMNQQTDTIHQYTPNIEQKELQALQNEANKLLETLKKHQTTQLSALQIIHYIRLIRQVWVLLNSNFQQVGPLHSAYQALLFTYLKITKEQLFVKLFAIIDKIEVELMLDPCSLSQPCMQWVSKQFESLTDHIQNLANFNTHPELLKLEDACFMKYRRFAITGLKNECEQVLRTLTWGEQQTSLLFNTSDLEPKNIAAYRVLAPYLRKIAPEIYKLETNEDSLISRLRNEDVVASIQHRLKHYFIKAKATEKLRQRQCDTLIKTIDERAELTLFPYNVFEGFDMTLRRVTSKHTDIKSDAYQKTLPKHRFILFKNYDKTYHAWGNDGTRFVLKEIPTPLIPENIIEQFSELANSKSLDKELPYHNRFSDFYSHIGTLRSHIKFASPLHCSETSVFQDSPPLSELMMVPIDWANTQLLSQPVKLTRTEFFPKKRRIEVSELNSHDQHNLLISDPATLRLEETWAIYHLYQNKIEEFNHAKKAYDELLQLIEKHFRNKIDALTINTKCLQKKCRRLYQYIQPYLSELPDFIKLDQYFIHAFSFFDETVGSKILINDKFYYNLKRFNFDQSKRVTYWQNRSAVWLQNAEDTYNKGPSNAKATEDNQREKFILQSQHLSTYIDYIRTQLFKINSIFNEHVQTFLRPEPQGVPFSRIPTQAEASPSIRFYIRLVNIFYHLKQLAMGLESLERVENTTIRNFQILKNQYTENIEPLLELGSALYSDPDMFNLLQEVYDNGLSLVPKCATLIRPYTTDVNTILPLEKIARYPHIWNVMNAVYLLPDTIQSLTQGKTWDKERTIHLLQIPSNLNDFGRPRQERLTLLQHNSDYYIYSKSPYGGYWSVSPLKDKDIIPLLKDINFTQDMLTYHSIYEPLYLNLVQKGYHVTPLDKTQRQAKQATLLVDYLIDNSESYWNLIFSGWSIYRLNIELQEKLSNITKISHNAVVDNLSVINHTHFGEWIKYLDRLEHRLGTPPGAFTNPAKESFDLWFQGLVFPLDMTFNKKQDLVCSSVTTQQRKAAEEAFRSEHANEKKHIEHCLNITQEFIKSYQECRAQSNPIEIIKSFLKKYDEDFGSQNIFLESYNAEDILNKVTTLEKNLRSSLAKTELSIENSNVKIQYLDKELEGKKEFQKNYRRSFAVHYFNEQVERYCRPPKSLSDEIIANEYATMLKAYFSKQLDTLLTESQNITNVEAVDTLIKKKLDAAHAEFVRIYKPYYKQLDTTLSVIEAFNTYLDTDRTLDKASKDQKKRLLEEIQKATIKAPDTTLQDLECHLIARLLAIKKLTLRHKKELLDHPNNQSTTYFQWLIACVCDLLSAVGLYPRPKQQQHYSALAKTSNLPTPVDGYLNCFSFFRHTSKKNEKENNDSLVFQI